MMEGVTLGTGGLDEGVEEERPKDWRLRLDVGNICVGAVEAKLRESRKL